MSVRGGGEAVDEGGTIGVALAVGDGDGTVTGAHESQMAMRTAGPRLRSTARVGS
jgi:hypothetical protein